MKRLIDAFWNSIDGFRFLATHEKAFRQECVLLIVALFAALPISEDWRGYALLISVILILMLVEALNTGIEKACDALSTTFDERIKAAKDCGSLAVLIASIIAAWTWGLAVIDWWLGY
ncbi:diacylglycerol kinase [Notoacmeibacter marinus]|uniref:Diacylglycerol kinase n=1 Tax=Notoacmeibacter marinus TaxID=1876515 RepID=A0A231UWH3_9HYPH|nr:diacylglycerol kinase [Notoacmeibacter marinus]OXT00288.1 diacylglycerol kinase [Notoacmeibacter marinus]